METKHAFFSPSASARWLNCTASLAFVDELKQTKKIKEDAPSKYAQEGTEAHTIAEDYARHEILGEERKTRGDEEMERHAEIYADYILALINDKYQDSTAIIATEQRVTLPTHPDECFGTVDCYLKGDKRIDIIDYKYGKGVTVRARKNTQLLIYAFCVFKSLTPSIQRNINEIGLHIIQPRLNNIDDYYITVEELKDFGERLEDTINAIKEGRTTTQGGKHCKFCSALALCRAYYDYLTQGTEKRSTPNELQYEEIKSLLDRADDLNAYINKVKTYVTEQLRNGIEVKGYKLVAGVRRRTITDEDQAVTLLKEAGFDETKTTKTTLRGLTELEKLCGKKAFNNICSSVITFKEGQPILTDTEDKREEIKVFEIPKELL